MNAELKRLFNWFVANKISFKESKTQLVLFCSARQHYNTVSNIKFKSLVLEPVEAVSWN